MNGEPENRTAHFEIGIGAALQQNMPVINQICSYGIRDIIAGCIEKLLGGKAYERLEIYCRCSQFTNAHQRNTPTLLMPGESGYCCLAEQSEQFYIVLKANGCIIEMLLLPGSSRTGSLNGVSLVWKAQNEALLDWMHRYVLVISG